MCSCSTTLFNAAMRAGLDIHARAQPQPTTSPATRSASTRPCGSPGRTAADDVVRQRHQYPILIKGINERDKVTFELYGVPDGRTVELPEPLVENIAEAGDWFEYTDELAAGEQAARSRSSTTLRLVVTRTVRDASGNVIHEDTFISHYKTIDAIKLVGRYPGDPSRAR